MVIHVVERGDSVWSIAQRYGVSTRRIISDNNISNAQNLVVGQALLILMPKDIYTARSGDTIASIAGRFGVSEMSLIQNNPELALSPLMAGQTVVISYNDQKIRGVYINGYAYPHIRREVLRSTLPYLTYLTIFGYGFTEDGELIGIDDQPLINMAYRYKTVPVMLLSSITEDGNFSTERASLLFNDIELQNKVIDEILIVMGKKGYLGLDVDFEYINPNDSAAFVSFLENLVSKLRPQGYFVNTDLVPKTSASQAGLLYEAHNYSAIGAISDTVLLMTYEWGYTYGPPMAVAPIDQVRRVVSYAVTEIPKEKIMMGIPNYGYDWPLPFEKGVTAARTVGNPGAVDIAARNGAVILFDEKSKSPYFEYWASDGVKHVVWFEDVRSIEAKYALMDEYELRGSAYWNVMRPFAQNWLFVNARYQIRKVL